MCVVVGNNVGIDVIPSPTTVLGGPYEGVYASNLALESSLEKVVAGCESDKSKGKSRMPLRKLMRKERSPMKIRSWRWGKDSLRDIDDGGDRSPSVRFCSWRWDSLRVVSGGGDDDGSSFGSGGKIGKVVRKNSFTFENSSTSSFLVSDSQNSIYMLIA